MLTKIISIVRKNKKITNLIESTPLVSNHAQKIYNLIKTYLIKNERIIDIGAGLCTIDKILLEKGYKLTPIDIKDLSLYENIKPLVYDGKIIPFKDKSFDVALILTVLHHISNPIKIIKEAKRVARRIIIVEDIYKNNFQKLLTFAVDSIINFEFFKHPHSNKSDKEWIQLFEDMELKLLHKKKKRFDSIFLHGIYHLE